MTSEQWAILFGVGLTLGIESFIVLFAVVVARFIRSSR